MLRARRGSRAIGTGDVPDLLITLQFLRYVRADGDWWFRSEGSESPALRVWMKETYGVAKLEREAVAVRCRFYAIPLLEVCKTPHAATL